MFWTKINFWVALLGQIYRLLNCCWNQYTAVFWKVKVIHTVFWFSMIWQNLTKTEGHEMMRSNFHVRFTIIPHNNYGVSPKFQFRLNSTLKRCQTQSLVWWWLDQKGANSPNILHSHLYWHPTIHSCLAKISWSGFEHGSNADDNHCTLLHFFPISKRYQATDKKYD